MLSYKELSNTEQKHSHVLVISVGDILKLTLSCDGILELNGLIHVQPVRFVHARGTLQQLQEQVCCPRVGQANGGAEQQPHSSGTCLDHVYKIRKAAHLISS